MATVIPYNLATGKIPGTVGAIYTASGSQVAIKLIKCVNPDASDIYINLYIYPGIGDNSRISPKDMVLISGYMAVDNDIHILNDGDAIWADASVDNTIEYYICGLKYTT